MQVNPKPEVWLEVEGSRREICNALRRAGESAVKFYDKWVQDACSLDDGDTHTASFLLEDAAELFRLVRALPEKHCYVHLGARAQAGGLRFGLNLEGMKGRTQAMAWSEIALDSQALDEKVRAAAQKARDLLDEAL